MNFKKTFLITTVLLLSVTASVFLIWQGVSLDINQEKPEVLGSLTPSEPPASPAASISAQVQKTYKVTKVVDGDTIQVNIDGKIFPVRLIGIDTPETVDPRRAVGCFGKKSSEETKRLIEGKNVTLTRDVSETDKYNRLLRYVFLPLGEGENLFVNDYLVRQGFAKTLTYPPDVKYDSRFVAAEREARENMRGLWGECK